MAAGRAGGTVSGGRVSATDAGALAGTCGDEQIQEGDEQTQGLDEQTQKLDEQTQSWTNKLDSFLLVSSGAVVRLMLPPDGAQTSLTTTVLTLRARRGQGWDLGGSCPTRGRGVASQCRGYGRGGPMAHSLLWRMRRGARGERPLVRAWHPSWQRDRRGGARDCTRACILVFRGRVAAMRHGGRGC